MSEHETREVHRREPAGVIEGRPTGRRWGVRGVRGFVVRSGAGQPAPSRVPGRHLKVTGADTDGAFMVVEYLLTADIPPHIHVRQHESFYVVAGELTVRVASDEFAAGPGDFVFLPGGIPHALSVASEEAPTLLVIATPNARSGGVWPVPPGLLGDVDPWDRRR